MLSVDSAESTTDTPDVEFVRRGIRSLLDRVCDSGPSTTIAIIRGGANLALLYSQETRRNIPIVLEHLLDLFPLSHFIGAELVVLDDTVFEGRTLNRTKLRLTNLGIAPGQVKTAALVVNARLAPADRPNFYEPGFLLDGPRYRSTADTLNRLIRQHLLRPVDADHVLYYFSIRMFDLRSLIGLLETLGPTRVVAKSTDVIRLTTDLGGSPSNPLLSRRRLHKPIRETAKIRWYIRVGKDGDMSLTAAPMISPDDVPWSELLELVNEADCGLSQEEVLWPPSQSGRVFMATALLSFALLRRAMRCFVDLLPRSVAVAVEAADHSLVCVPPRYEEFYGRASELLWSDVRGRPNHSSSIDDLATDACAFSEECYPVQAVDLHRRQLSISGLSPEMYVAGLVGKLMAENMTRGVTYGDLVSEVGDESWVSSALDTLLDHGMLTPRLIAANGGGYTRCYLPGGEQRQSVVRRLARMLDCPPLRVVSDARAPEDSDDESDSARFTWTE